MAQKYEFKSLVRPLKVGAAYESADDLLNPEGALGWQLIAVVAFRGKLVDDVFEVFYLQRAGAIDAT